MLSYPQEKYMKRILITGAGGTPSTNFIRSLKLIKEKLFFIGIDCNEYYLQRAETDLKFLVPPTSSRFYIPMLEDVIKETKPDLIYAQPDQEIYKISLYRKRLDKLKVKIFLPRHEVIKICQNKWLSYKKWREAGIKVPCTFFINNISDLKKAFKILGGVIWLRNVMSPGGGKGSFFTDKYEMGKAWMDYSKGWGNFIASECLTKNTITWLSIWKKGELIVAQGRKRLYWEFGNRAPSGVTGLTGTGVTIASSFLDNIAEKAIVAIDSQPNGIYGVDCTLDKNRMPTPTEINIGRFFTTHLFFTKAGLNLPYIFVKLAFDEPIPKIKKKVNPLPEGLAWVRGMDFLPILTDFKKIQNCRKELKKRIEKIEHSYR